MSIESLKELVTGIESAGNPVTLKVIELFRARIIAVQVTETPDEEVEALLTELISELTKALEPSTQNFTPEQLTQLEQLEKDHKDSVLTMDMFELTPKAKIPQPTFEQIIPNLTPEMLETVKYLHEPKLVCVPTRAKDDTPIKVQEIAQALDKANSDGKMSQVYAGSLTRITLVIKDGSKVKYRKGTKLLSQLQYFAQSQEWEVWIVEGADEMPYPAIDVRYATDFPKGPMDSSGRPTEATNQEKHDYMYAKYASLNLEGLTYETWLVLLMDAFRKQRKIDINSYTQLLNNDLAIQYTLAYACGNYSNLPSLGDNEADGRTNRWRSRAAIRVM